LIITVNPDGARHGDARVTERGPRRGRARADGRWEAGSGYIGALKTERQGTGMRIAVHGPERRRLGAPSVRRSRQLGTIRTVGDRLYPQV